LGLISAAAAEDQRSAEAESPAAPSLGIEVEVTDGLLTLRADGEPVADVLRAVGVAGAFEVVLRGAFAMPVREWFADRPLEDAIRRLLEGHSVVFLRNDRAPASAAAGLAQVRAIENSARTAAEDANRDDAGLLSANDDATEKAQLGREAFRLANRGVPPPTGDDILFELGEPDQAARVTAIPKVGSLQPREAVAILSGVFAEDEDPAGAQPGCGGAHPA
jgi:hypothetical protein